jgi:hypothetical protein
MDELKLAPVIDLPCVTSLNLDADKVISKAAGKLTQVVIVGYDRDGEFYFASSVADGPEVLWALEQAKLKLLNIGQ